MGVREARVARDTVAFMTKQVQAGSRFGQLFDRARQLTEHFKEKDSIVLARRRPENLHDTVVEVTAEDTLFAAKRLREDGYTEPCVLNFADAFLPGGLFLQGVTTQEERLARCTGLYWCLKDQAYYSRNREHHKSHPFYLHDLLYSPSVPVFKDLATEEGVDESEVYPISIVTCPAPNQYEIGIRSPRDGDRDLMGERIRRILTVMANKKHKAIVLGAYGCGAFGNDPEMVANHFKYWLEGDLQGYFAKVVFAVYVRVDPENHEVFTKVLG